MDDLDVAAQPHCPDCRVVMRPQEGGDECPACGRRIEWPHVEHPGDGDGIVDL
ncbi:hypothetical protein [Microbacterium karelineae]|uniref:hypothetical protein n=1 Tax=Microbacterium karelineae TaxID=2654283 RepID=UPI0012E9BAC9|nr:hypothetical protein [Microbacterium karelineae]